MSNRNGFNADEQLPEDHMPEFAAMIAQGLQEPIDIRPTGEFWSGHQRLAAAKALHISEVCVRVRLP